MDTSITYLAVQERVNDLHREAQRSSQLRDAQHDEVLGRLQHNRARVKVRRVAVIRPAGSHFALMPARALLDPTGR
jgi:ABC-type uncharacterized transport system fused permease/ATPase subunit